MVAILFSLSILLLDICDAHNICKDSGGGNARACSVALNEHGELFVALGGEQDDVVATLKVVEGMVTVDLAERY